MNNTLELKPVSQWMSDKRYFQLSRGDVAVRLDLISRFKGIDQAVIYFNDIPKQMKCAQVYGSLLNCYVEEKSMEKAEDLMQKMRDLGFLRYTLSYNNMLSLYCKTGNYDKLKPLLHEMKEKGIVWDKFTYSILLASYSASCSIEDIDVIFQKMESEPEYRLDWDSYTSAADAYKNVGCVDKASMMLKKAEGLIQTSKRKSLGYEFLITHYSAMGNKAEVLRLWEVYKKHGKIYNTGYKSMITSLLKLDDKIGAENVFEEWEDSQLSYDFRIPNSLISYYCKKGLMGKAEALVERAEQRNKKPIPCTWYFLATGYIGCDQPQKAVEAMKRGIAECRQGWQLPSKDILVACLEYMKGNNDVKEAKEFVRSLVAKDIVSADIEKELLNYFETDKEDISGFMEGDFDRQGKVPET
ncbi:pentatricopeptide repeat-containing protein At2g20710, mitochondrial-like [Apium graveolens]|uniref:pentatricopeptide repeat-containing protein At2g20710, mitochondrial-like n=1 Tax=Apium graveolens TaxID=4045 RepID=UPI003D79DC04